MKEVFLLMFVLFYFVSLRDVMHITSHLICTTNLDGINVMYPFPVWPLCLAVWPLVAFYISNDLILKTCINSDSTGHDMI